MLYYHHVFSTKNPYHPDDLTSADFETQISFLAKYFNILPIEYAMTLLKQGELPPKALVISFDDGYEDNYTNAASILDKHNCPATFFIASQGIESGYLWNDIIEQALKKTQKKSISKAIIDHSIKISTKSEKQEAFKTLTSRLKFENHQTRSEKITLLTEELAVFDFNKTMMDARQIADLHRRGFTIGAHTHSHTILATETHDLAEQELIENKNSLESIIGSKVNYLAFPNGLFDRDFYKEHCDTASRLGFHAAFSTNDGGALSDTHLFRVPRFMPYRKQLPLFALSIAKIAGEHV